MLPEELALYSHPKMQELFEEKMGYEEPYDRIWHPDYGYGSVKSNTSTYLRVAFENREKSLGYHERIIIVRLPLPIDLVNAERGLWGMVEGYKELKTDHGGKSSCETNTAQSGVCETPTLALLRALAHQWEVEICPPDKLWFPLI